MLTLGARGAGSSVCSPLDIAALALHTEDVSKRTAPRRRSAMTAYTIDISTHRRKDFDQSRSKVKRAGATYDPQAKTWSVEIDEAGSDDANDQLNELIWIVEFNGAKVYADGTLVDVDELKQRSRAAYQSAQQRRAAE